MKLGFVLLGSPSRPRLLDVEAVVIFDAAEGRVDRKLVLLCTGSAAVHAVAAVVSRSRSRYNHADGTVVNIVIVILLALNLRARLNVHVMFMNMLLSY